MTQLLIQDTPEYTATWSVEKLWDAAKGLPVKRFKVSDFPELNSDAWFAGVVPTCRDIAEHYRRIAAANLDDPIILSSDGRVMDGMHRLVKAYAAGFTYINVVQFSANPLPDEIQLSLSLHQHV